jgi:hypothetical protein
VSEEAKRIEDRLNRIAGSDEATVGEAYDYLDFYEQDVPYLLKRVEELEAENKGLSISETHHATLLSDCEMENRRLRTQLAEIQKGGEFGVAWRDIG